MQTRRDLSRKVEDRGWVTVANRKSRIPRRLAQNGWPWVTLNDRFTHRALSVRQLSFLFFSILKITRLPLGRRQTTGMCVFRDMCRCKWSLWYTRQYMVEACACSCTCHQCCLGIGGSGEFSYARLTGDLDTWPWPRYCEEDVPAYQKWSMLVKAFTS